MNGANFIIGQHERDQGGIGAEGVVKFRQADVAELINAEHADLKSVHALEIVHGGEDGFVFCRGSNDVFTARIR